MTPHAIGARFRDIESRLAALEKVIFPLRSPSTPKLEPDPDTTSLPSPPQIEEVLPLPAPRRTPPPILPSIETASHPQQEPPTPPVTEIPPAPIPFAHPTPQLDGAPPVSPEKVLPAHLKAIPPTPLTYQPASEKTPVASSAFERTLGLKWTAWLGAVVFVIGAGLGLKFAYDQGWLGGIPPTIRLILFSLGSFALLSAGEYAYRKINRLASVGLHAAGIASLFLIAYAGHAYYALYSSTTAFAFTAIAALAGSLISARTRLLSIAIVSLAGAHLAPVVLQGNAGLFPFLTYLTALHATALLLAYHGTRSPQAGGRWWNLRGLSMAASVLWVFYLTTRIGPMPVELPVFALLVTMLAHIELAFAAFKKHIHTPETTAYVLLSSAFPIATLFFYSGFPSTTLFICLSIAAVVSGTVAHLLRHHSAFAPFGRTYRLQGVLLFAAALPLGLTGDMLWMAAAATSLAAAIYTAVRKPLPEKNDFSFAPLLSILTLGTALFPLVTASLPLLQSPHAPWLPTPLKGLALSLLTLLIGYLHARPVGRTWPLPFARFLATVGSGLFILFAVTAATGFVSIYLIVGLAWAFALAAQTKRGWLERLLPQMHAYALLALALFKFLVFDVTGSRFAVGYTVSHDMVLINTTVMTMLLFIGSILFMPKLFRRAGIAEDTTAPAPLFPIIAAFILTFFTGLLEIDRAVSLSGSLAPFGLNPILARFTLSTLWSTVLFTGFALFTRKRGDSFIAMPSVTVLLLLGGGAALTSVSTLTDHTRLTPFANLPFMTASAIAAAAIFLAHLLRKTTASAISYVAPALLFIAGSAELVRFAQLPIFTTFPVILEASLLITIWACAIMMLTWVTGRRFAATWPAYRHLPSTANVLLIILSIKVCVLDLVVPWCLGVHTRGAPIGNLQLAAAAALVSLLIIAIKYIQPLSRTTLYVMAGLATFAATSIEVARLLSGIAPASNIVVTAGYSVWWSVFALGLIGLGFMLRKAPMRYTGLALFGLTLGKVVLLDLSSAGNGWRILSLFAVSALLLVTSLLYGKLAPLFLKDEEELTSSPQIPERSADHPAASKLSLPGSPSSDPSSQPDPKAPPIPERG